ncbi:hypothetical protein C5Y93_18360 [Blastopirellula marina]|uniref:Uncharacterized protein n=1 Tax=Blastopirellula marina TaxID=124 RepID=A0A2S8GJW1_9BACT|nr:hypothetical protein C5Y93_18360 [Blastopirellula marina]
MIVTWEHSEAYPGLWLVTFANVEGEYELSGPFPVQGVGSVQGTDFYFRARNYAWEFETNDETGGLFSPNDRRAFQRSSLFPKADSMPFSQAATIIAHCVGEFLEQVA